ncbi:MAG: DNA polymerase [Planctomycetota bacterium]|nr:DNA polymerase [Planctomycetota bacterium]
MLRVLYIDMNSYFASVEQHFRPELRGKPIAVVPVEADTTSCIAASYPAKAYGVRTGTKVGDAKRMCPGLILVRGRPDLYVRVHHEVLAAIDTVLPVHAVHSIDECSCRLVEAERSPGAAEAIGHRVKRAITTRVGECLTSSVGVAPNRFLAKVAADLHKPDGLTILDDADIPARLLHLAITDLPGIGPKMRVRLDRAGVRTISDLYALDEAGLRRAWGSVVGAEWYYLLRGLPVNDPFDGPRPRRTIGHSHVLGPDSRDEHRARQVGVRLLTKVGQRARHLGYVAEWLTLSLRYLRSREDRLHAPDSGPPERWHDRASLAGAADAEALLRAFASMWARRPPGHLLQIGVTLHDLARREAATPSLFDAARRDGRLSSAIDRINQRFGADAVYPAAMHEARKSAPRRIAFGNIPDLGLPDLED